VKRCCIERKLIRCLHCKKKRTAVLVFRILECVHSLHSLISYFLVILLTVFHQSVRNRSFYVWGIVVIHTRSCWGDRHCVFFIDKQC
jgi:hypothetical protein